MKKIIFLLALTLCSITTFAVTISGHAKVTIVGGIQVAETQQLNFGTFVVGTASSTVTIAADGTRTSSGDNVPIGTGFNSGTFSIIGTPSTGFNFTVPTGSITLTGATTAQTITVGTFTASATSGTTNAAGTAIMKVGATANLIGSQAVDTYNGTYDVIVAYQ